MGEFESQIDLLQVAPYVRFVHEVEIIGPTLLTPRVIYDHEIIFVTQGTCNYTIENQEYNLCEGDVQYMRPFIRHSLFVPEGERMRCYAVHFDFLYLGESMNFSAYEVYLKNKEAAVPIALSNRLSDRPSVELRGFNLPAVLPIRERHTLEHYFRELLAAFELKEYGSPVWSRAAMLNIIGLILRELSNSEGVRKAHLHSDRITQAIQYLYRHYAELIDLNKLAHSYNMSPKYFRVIFKQATGKTMVEFLMDVRMEKAKELLREHKFSVQEVAAKVGYDDLYYFSKLFKKMEGISPKHYADSLRGKMIQY